MTGPDRGWLVLLLIPALAAAEQVIGGLAVGVVLLASASFLLAARGASVGVAALLLGLSFAVVLWSVAVQAIVFMWALAAFGAITVALLLGYVVYARRGEGARTPQSRI